MMSNEYDEYVRSVILFSRFARALRYFHLGRRYVTSWWGPDGSIRLGSIWHTCVASLISIWGNGEPMFNICHTYTLGMNILISLKFTLYHDRFCFKWTYFITYLKMWHKQIWLSNIGSLEFNNWYAFVNESFLLVNCCYLALQNLVPPPRL